MYDTLVIELQKEGKSVGSISILKQDLQTLQNSHGTDIPTIVADMIKTLEDGIENGEGKN